MSQQEITVTHSGGTALTHQSRRLVFWGLVINTFFAAIKIASGIIGNSRALLVDGLESILDIFHSLLMWTALKFSEKPPDAEHPYGHGKIETLAGFFGGFFLILSGVIIGWNSLSQIASFSLHRPHPAPFTLIILTLVVLIKGFFSHITLKKNKTINSSALSADAWHHGADAMTSLAAFIGISLSLTGLPQFRVADDWAALFSCAIIVFNGINILRLTTKEIMDTRVSQETVDQILKCAASVPGVQSVEKCRVRKSGLILIADLHVRVDGNLSVHQGHQISHDVIRHLVAATELKLRDITIHLEPS